MYIKTKLLSLVLACASTFLFAQQPIDFVSERPTIVLSMNPQHLNKKVNLEQLTGMGFFQDMIKGMSGAMNPEKMESVQAVLQSPSDFGMDFMSDSYFVVDMTDEGSFFSYIFKLSDTQKAASFFKDQEYESEDFFGNKTGAKYKPGRGYEYLDMGSNGKLVWKNGIAMFVNGDVEYDYEEYSTEEFNEADSLSNLALDAYAQNLIIQSNHKSIQTNPRFVADTRDSDMHLWIDNAYLQKLNGDQVVKGLGEYGMIDMWYPHLMSLYEDTYTSMGLNFDKGAMNMDFKSYMNPRLAKIMAATVDSKMNKKLHKYIKGDELLGYMAFDYSFKNSMEASKDIVYDMMRDIPMVGEMANSAMDIVGIFVDEEAIYDLFKGDMVLAMTGLQEFEKEVVSYEYDDDFNRTETKTLSKQTLPEMTMMMSYGNKKDLMKFVRLGEQVGVLESAGKYFKIISEELPVDMYMAMHDGILFLTNDTDLVGKHLGSGFPRKQRLSRKQCKTLKNSAATFFWDVPQTLDMVDKFGGELGFSGTQMLNLSKDTFGSMLFTTEKSVQNNMSKGKMTFNFTNKEQNSLEQFFNYINDIYITEMGGRSM